MSEDKEKEKNLSDIFKKVVSTGISAAFLTEEAIKSKLQDLPVPKELVNGLVQNAKNSKEELVKSVKAELSNYLNKIDISKEIDRIVDKYDIEINAKLKLTPKDKKTKKKEE